MSLIGEKKDFIPGASGSDFFSLSGFKSAIIHRVSDINRVDFIYNQEKDQYQIIFSSKSSNEHYTYIFSSRDKNSFENVKTKIMNFLGVKII